MPTLTIPRSQFAWHRFANAVEQLALEIGCDEAFPIVDGDQLVFWQDHDELEDVEPDDIPMDPLERLDAGFDLFAYFTAPSDCGELLCADRQTLIVPDLDDEDYDDDDDDEDDDEHGTRSRTPEEVEAIENTIWNELSAYGFVISAVGENLVFTCRLTGENRGVCEVCEISQPNLIEAPMMAFLRSCIVGARS